MKPAKPKVARMWAVYFPSGRMCDWTVQPTRRQSIKAYFTANWRASRVLGYRCRRVRVVPEERK